MDPTPAFVGPRPGRHVWRVGRCLNPAALCRSKRVSELPATAGSRVDPSDGRRAFLYVADSLDGAYMEMLQALREDE